MATIRKHTWKNGEVSYKVEVRLKGHPRKTATFEKQSYAVKWGEDVEHALKKGLPLPGEAFAEDDKSINDAVDDYLDITELIPDRSIHTIDTDRSTGKRLKKRFGELSLRTLKAEDIEEYKMDRLSVVGPATIRHDMSMLSRIYEMARVKWRMTGLDYPGKGIKLPGEPKERTKIVPENKYQDLLRECKASKNEMLFPIVLLLLSTGMRPAEAITLHCWQVVLDEGILDLTKTKTDPRRVPIPQESNGNSHIVINGNVTLQGQQAQEPDFITSSQGYEIQQLIYKLADLDIACGYSPAGVANARRKWWYVLRTHFKTTSYKCIPYDCYDDAIYFLNHHKNKLQRDLVDQQSSSWRKKYYTAIYARCNDNGTSKLQLYQMVGHYLDVRIDSLKQLSDLDLKRLYKIILES